MSTVHDGHRDRVKKQFLKEGFPDSMPDHKILEMILFYSIPRKDTNELAHKLIQTFGSFSNVLDASPEEIMKINGISENTACLLKTFLPVYRRYELDKQKDNIGLTNRFLAAKYLKNFFIGRTVETVFILCLDDNGRVISCHLASEGDEISVGISARTVVEQAIKTHATTVLIGHNHPSGILKPSNSDIILTKAISNALLNLGIRFYDHVIYANNSLFSMADQKEYALMFN